MTNVHRLFFAVRPDLGARSMAVDAMQRQMDAHHLSGSPVAAERLHVTLHWLGDHDEAPQEELLRQARSAGASVEVAPFGVGFSRIGSLGGAEMGGLVLTGSSEELKALRQFQRALAATMDAAGIGHYTRKKFTPHISLLYGEQRVPREEIEPIGWRVDELVLIDSLVGHRKHIELGRWPLRSRQMSFEDW